MGNARHRLRIASIVVAPLLFVACGSSGDTEPGDPGRPSIVVTTNILGDVVRQSVGDLVDVEVIMPLGSDPHDFAPSARQAEAIEQADLLVVNGAGFEAGMNDIILNARDSGTLTFTAADHVSLLTLTDHGESGLGDEPHDGVDPHLWTDPSRVAQVVEALGSVLEATGMVDSEQLSESVDAYIETLHTLAAEMDAMLAVVPAERRILVTNHEVFGYFADRFDFTVIGTVIPSLSTGAEPSAASLERLAALIEAEGVPAVFAETTSSSRLAEVLAGEVGGDLSGGIEVIELFSESLGDTDSGAETYVDMMFTNAALIAGALGGE